MRLRVWLPVVAVAVAGFARAQPADELPAWHPLRADRQAAPREEPSTTMSERVYRQLSETHELLGDGKLDAALARLQGIGMRNLRPYELAQIHQAFGFIHAQRGEDDEALAAFERCVQLDALPTFAQQGIVYSVASLYAAEERYAESTETAMRWFRHEPKPGADAYMLVGVNHVQLDDMAAGLPYVRHANDIPPARESWLQVELAILVETGQLAEAIVVAEEMIALWPDNARHYEALAGLLMETGQDARALSALTVPWLAGLLDNEQQILTLARLNLHLDSPARGAQVLAAAIDDGRVDATTPNLELLLNAWSAARETTQAAAVTDRLAAQAEDGEYHLRKALLLNEEADWPGVADAAGAALEKGGLERPGEAWVLRGVALAELARFDAALDAFEAATREGRETTRRNAAAWVTYVRVRAAETP